MSETEVKHGVIGFFDILGYQNFLENHEPESAVDEVLNILLKIERRIPEFIVKGLGDKSALTEIVKEIEWLIFSDTILITMAIEQKDDNEIKQRRWLMFLIVSCILIRYMFEQGLPLRGAICTGKYIVKETCFAGRPIIDAFQLTKDIDIASCVLSGTAYGELCELRTSKITIPRYESEFKKLLIDYLVPQKSKKSEKLQTLNFLMVPSIESKKIPPDIRQYVCDTFWKHNKDISQRSYSKLENTEQFLRFVKYKFPKIFE